MMKHLAAVVLLALTLLEPAAAAGLKFTTHDLRSEKALRQLYERWCKHFKVARKPAEKVHRFANFKQTVHRVASRTVRVADEPLRLNGFADATRAEFEGCKCRMTPEPRVTAAPGTILRDLPLPVSVDWRGVIPGVN
ncbi:hypothetical protein SEVIR_7G340460v4 [Setaria viridis]|uniref:Cathepsin propeptide inhibitor domain-containing protein n=2 Tax=Setaria viridis TaxID=4556 RepID=A0A4U6TZR7_SETVI|nr:hypothetical protein SEVIR_7G340460v2 [Setaria viridis]